MRQKEAEQFKEWITKMEKSNVLLRDTPLHLTEDELRSQAESAICKELRHAYRDAKTKEIVDFIDWRNSIVELDDK